MSDTEDVPMTAEEFERGECLRTYRGCGAFRLQICGPFLHVMGPNSRTDEPNHIGIPIRSKTPIVAALALYGHPMGFTHDDVTMLRASATNWQTQSKFSDNPEAEKAWMLATAQAQAALADRIAALLPPAKRS